MSKARKKEEGSAVSLQPTLVKQLYVTETTTSIYLTQER